MAWTTPRTWVTAEVVTASHMNTHVRDNTAYLKDSPRFDGSPTVANNMTWDGTGWPIVERTDGSGNTWQLRMVISGSDTPRLDVQKNGSLHSRIEWDDANNLWRIPSILKVDTFSGEARFRVDNTGATGGFGLEVLAGTSGTQIRDMGTPGNRVLIDGSKWDFQTTVQIDGEDLLADYTTADNLSDVTTHTSESTSTSSTITLLDISGSGQLLAGALMGNITGATAIIDGTSNAIPIVEPMDDGVDKMPYALLPPIRYDSSLKVTFTTSANSRTAAGTAWTKP